LKTIRTNTYRDLFKSFRYVVASLTIGFDTGPIHFDAPAFRLASIPRRFGLSRIGIWPPVYSFGSFRYQFESKGCRSNSKRYRKERKQLPFKSIKYRDIRFFDITLTQSDIALTQGGIVLSLPEISWTHHRFAPCLREFISFRRRLSSARSHIAPWPTESSLSRKRLSSTRCDRRLSSKEKRPFFRPTIGLGRIRGVAEAAPRKL